MSEQFTQQEWLDELEQRFGRDPMKWAFVCPTCHDIATGQDFRDALEGTDRQASDYLGQQCIGRVLGALSGPQEGWKGRGCDWCAFGLFRGPVLVTLPDGKEIGAFSMAPGPSQRPGSRLTVRERQVLGMVAEDMTGAAIATRLGLAPNTVAQHLASARRKYGVRTSLAAAHLAFRDAQLPGSGAAVTL